ncbi:DMT family transporter [Oceanithermus sp.]
MNAHLRGLLALTFVTLIWGSTFVVVKGALEQFPPSLLMLLRFLVGAAFFLPFWKRARGAWGPGLDLAFWAFLGYATQTIGLLYTTAGRSAFITALSVVLVPVLAGLAGRRVPVWVWLGALASFVGVGLLAYDGSPPNAGDLWTLATAVTYAVYILRLELHTRTHDAFVLSLTQLVGLALFVGAWAWVSGDLAALAGLAVPWGAVLYLGVAATALTTWLMAVGQRSVSAPEAAVIYSMEPVWAATFAYFVLGEVLGLRGLVGGALVVLAVAGVQWSAAAAEQGRASG